VTINELINIFELTFFSQYFRIIFIFYSPEAAANTKTTKEKAYANRIPFLVWASASTGVVSGMLCL